jgi:5'-nucleotidase
VPNRDGGGDKLIVEALSYGIAYDVVDLTIDRRSGDVVAKTGRVPATAHDLAGDTRVARLVESYRARVAPLATRVLGESRGGLTRAGGELGALAADAQREFARADAAVVDPGAMRADIDPGPVTYAEVAEAFAYGHPVVRARLTGQQLQELAGDGRFYSGPSDLDPTRTYTVAASEMLLPDGRPVGTEADAVASYLNK